ncbi:MAG: hypothetical protein HY554_05070 [Elusimicrobia bacterium]|nr:hypothetical protein [Elusimicrobiota bacterium]
MIRAVTQRVGSTVQLLVPFHALRDSASLSDRLLRDLKLQNAPVVFIPVNRG